MQQFREVRADRTIVKGCGHFHLTHLVLAFADKRHYVNLGTSCFPLVRLQVSIVRRVIALELDNVLWSADDDDVRSM